MLRVEMNAHIFGQESKKKKVIFEHKLELIERKELFITYMCENFVNAVFIKLLLIRKEVGKAT